MWSVTESIDLGMDLKLPHKPYLYFKNVQFRGLRRVNVDSSRKLDLHTLHAQSRWK